MITYNYTELLHVEADNLLYGRITSILPILRKYYPNLAATPLNVALSFITASVFWVQNLPALQRFNQWLLSMGLREIRNPSVSNLTTYEEYLTWLKIYACCKPGSSIMADSQGNGIKPFAINEMSMLGYYQEYHPDQLAILPVVPMHEGYIKTRYTRNISEYSPGGSLGVVRTGAGIWDPNSWGQYLGGTQQKKGKNKKFTDATHIIGQAMRTTTNFQIGFICSSDMHFKDSISLLSKHDYRPLSTLKPPNITFPTFSPSLQPVSSPSTPPVDSSPIPNPTPSPSSHPSSSLELPLSLPFSDFTLSPRLCYTIPHVRFGSDDWTPLWNLHIHSKHTHEFMSEPCDCDEAPLLRHSPTGIHEERRRNRKRRI